MKKGRWLSNLLLIALLFSNTAAGQDLSRSDWFDAFLSAPIGTESAVMNRAIQSQTSEASAFLERLARRYPKGRGSLSAASGLTRLLHANAPQIIGELIRGPLSRDEREALVDLLSEDILHADDSFMELLDLLRLYAAQPGGALIVDALKARSWEAMEESVRARASIVLGQILDDAVDESIERGMFDLAARLEKQAFLQICLRLVESGHKRLFGAAAAQLLSSGEMGVSEFVLDCVFLEPDSPARLRILNEIASARISPMFWFAFIKRVAQMSVEDAIMLNGVLAKGNQDVVRPIVSASLSKVNSPSGRMLLLKHLLSLEERIDSEWLTDCARSRDPRLIILAEQALGLKLGRRSRLKELLGESPGETRTLRLSILAEVGTRDEGLAKYCKSRLLRRGTPWEELTVLPGVIMQVTERSCSVEELMTLVNHKSWSVQLRGAQYLGECRQRAAIEALIPLTSHPRRRIAMEAAQSLARLTGKALGLNPRAWADWFAAMPESWTPSKRASPASTASGYGATFYGLRLKSNRIAFVCDTSGSMQGARIQSLAKQTRGALAGMKTDTKFNIIFFDSTVKSLFKRLRPATKSTVRFARQYMKKLGGAGSTNLYGGLSRALADKDVDTIVLLSDGSPSAGKLISSPDILSAVHKTNAYRSVRIHTLFLSDSARNEVTNHPSAQFLKELAKQNDGTYRSVSSELN